MWGDERADMIGVYRKRARLAAKLIERLMDSLFDDVDIPWHLSRSTKLKMLERYWQVEVLDHLPLDRVYNFLGVLIHTGVAKPEKGYIVPITILLPRRMRFVHKGKAWGP